MKVGYSLLEVIYNEVGGAPWNIGMMKWGGAPMEYYFCFWDYGYLGFGLFLSSGGEGESVWRGRVFLQTNNVVFLSTQVWVREVIITLLKIYSGVDILARVMAAPFIQVWMWGGGYL